MKRLKSFFKATGSHIGTLSAKKIAVIALVAAVIIAPTVLALGYVIHNEYLKVSNRFSVTLYTPDDRVIATDIQDPEIAGRASLCGIFYQMTSKPVPVNIDTSVITNDSYVRAITEYNGTVSEYKCYFSTDTSAGYYIDESNKAYLISEKINTAFLSTSYAELFYPSAVAVPLITADLDVIYPKSASWYYKNTSDQYVLSTQNRLTDTVKTYEITGAIDISFEQKPDITYLKVFNGSTEIYNGDISELSSLATDINDRLLISLKAKWEQREGAAHYGELEYEFYVQIKNRSSFTISSDKVNAGGFIILDCTNVTDVSKLMFSCDRQGYTPVFKRYNGVLRAVIPFSEDSEAESMSFTVSYGAASQDFTVNIIPRPAKSDFSSDTLTFDSVETPDLLNAEIKATILEASIRTPYDDMVYFRGNFSAPTDNGYTSLYSHGSTVRWGETLEHSYTAIGNKYVSASDTAGGSSVTSLQNGIVAHVGNDRLLGKYVVIDHGCGLRSWYTGLGQTDVDVGDLLLIGQHIGKASAENSGGKDSFTLYCTVYDTLIDPDTLFK